jgi:hypothetical protein
MYNVFSHFEGANLQQETLKTKKVSKVLQLFNTYFTTGLFPKGF